MRETRSTSRLVAGGAAWMLLMRFSVKGIGLISTVILARLLAPQDFGLVALAMTVVAFVELLNTVGLDSALIQNQKATQEHYFTAWTMQILLGLLSAALLASASWWVPGYFSEPKLHGILLVLALYSLVSSLTNIGIVEFRKNMTFKFEFKYQVLSKALAFAVTVSLALWLRSYWALIIGQLFSSFLRVVLSYTMHPMRPRLSLMHWQDIYNFSIWLQINNIFYFINDRLQFLFIGRFGSASDVGQYTVANEIATLTTIEIVAPVNRAAFPGYAQVSDDREKLSNTYLNVFSSIAIIAIPSAIGIALVAPELVAVFLGDQWFGIVSLIQVIALSSIFSALSTNTGYIYLVLQKQQITTYIIMGRSILFIGLLMYLVPKNGAMGAAIATLFAGIVTFPVTQTISSQILNITFSAWLTSIYRPAIASALMALVVCSLREWGIISSLGSFIRLISLTSAGALVFVIVSLLLAKMKPDQSAELFMLKSAMSILANFRARFK